MEPQFGLTRIPCPTHPTEPIVKVSLEPTDQKLLYCVDCLEAGVEASKKAKFVKFQDFIQSLYEQYSELLSASVEAPIASETKEFLLRQEQAQIDFSREMKKQKTTADEEIKKIEKQISELLQTVRTSSHTRLDQFEAAIKAVFNEYNQKVTEHKNILSGSNEDTPTQSALNKKIFDTNNTEEAEKNLRSVLNELEKKKELRKGTAFEEIQRMQAKLESAGDNHLIVPEKSDKFYASQIKLLLNYFEALLSSLAEEPEKEKAQNEEEPKESELNRQKQTSDMLQKGLIELEKQLQPSNEKIDSILEKKFKLEVTDWECPVSKNGINPVEGRAYKCLTCISKYEELQASDIICEDCRSFCHRGHQLEYVGTQSFVCQCQFALRDCQLATDCLYRYTTSNSYRMATFKCKVCEMASSRVLCGFCARQCHEQHGYTYHTMQNTYCDCRGLFNFCKYHELGNNPQ